MIRSANAPRTSGRSATAMVATVASLSCSMVVASVLAARAETSLPASASAVRSAVVAMSLADAAAPFAEAVVTSRDASGSWPSQAVMKPTASDAMASMRTTAARRYTTASAAPLYDRRGRAYRDPFLLILGVAY